LSDFCDIGQAHWRATNVLSASEESKEAPQKTQEEEEEDER
jgi:hypothetical protein